MIGYGRRSPIGSKSVLRICVRKTHFSNVSAVRQERLLQGLMREIVRMTAQKQPLEVGVPLYQFSHTSLFRTDDILRRVADGTFVPLPLGREPPTSESIINDSDCFMNISSLGI